MTTNKIDLDTRIIDLTLRQVLDAVEARIRSVQAEREQPAQPGTGRYVYGLKGLAELLGCSKTTASRLKQSGKISKAITQIGALIIVDAEEVMRIMKQQ